MSVVVTGEGVIPGLVGVSVGCVREESSPQCGRSSHGCWRALGHHGVTSYHILQLAGIWSRTDAFLLPTFHRGGNITMTNRVL